MLHRGLARVLALAALGAVAAAQNYKLHPSLDGGRDVLRYDVSADGKRVVYLANQDVPGVYNVYSVDVAGGALKRLESRPCYQFVISPDSRRVVFTRYGDALASVPIDGSGAPIDIGPYTSTFNVTPDGRTVVFLTSAGLYSVPIDGSAAPILLHSSTPWHIHFHFVFTPDSQSVVYVTEGSIGFLSGMGHAYCARLDGSSPPQVLNSAAAPVCIGSFVVSPDSRWLLFREGSIQAFSKGVYTVPLDGSVLPRPLHPLGPLMGLIFTSFTTPRFSSDGNRVVFVRDDHGDARELYSNRVDGAAQAVKLNASLPEDGQVLKYRITADDRVVYNADQEVADQFELYIVPIEGGTPRKVNVPVAPGGNVYGFELSPDGRRIAYAADQEGNGEFHVYLSALDPGFPVVRLTDHTPAPPEAPMSFSPVQFAQGGKLLLYEGYFGGYQLYAVGTDGPPRPWRLDGPQVPGGSVRNSDPFPVLSGDDYLLRVGAGDTRVVYCADQDHDEVFELFASPLSVHKNAKHR